MSKKRQIKKLKIEEAVMAKVSSNEIVMRPRWYFVAGSILMISGLVATSIVGVFLANLTFFLLRQHGPNGQWRLQQILESFPLWVPFLALASLFFGIKLLKSYDFSYQKNFKLIILGFVLSILLTAFLIDYTGLSDIWTKRGPMMRFYQQKTSEQNSSLQPERGRGQGQYRIKNINNN